MSEESIAPDTGERYRLDPELLAERIGQDLIVVHLGNSRIFELNGTGSRLFELMREGRSRSEIEERLTAEFDVEPQSAAAAVDRFVESLRAKGLLR